MLYEMIKSEIENAVSTNFDETEGEAWFQDGTGIAYKMDLIEEDGCWIAAKLLEKEGGTTWDWSDPMFYPYKG